MGAHLERGRLLLTQKRYDLALEEFRKELAGDPGCSAAHALGALCLLEREDVSAARSMAQQALGHGPDEDLSHYAMAKVRWADGDRTGALASIREAIRLDPNEPDWRALRAAYLHDTEQWSESLAEAESGLRLNPLHVACQNIRGMALMRLGRNDEARASLTGTLSLAPQNSHSHAALGWSSLRSGRVSEALERFGEALRLDPESDYARQGLVSALKARSPVYRAILSYFFWVSNHSRGARMTIVFGLFLASRFAAPLAAVWALFAISTWLADPLFNLALLFHPVGRHALSQDQRRTAKSVGALLAFAVVLGLVAVGFRSLMACWIACAFACLALPLSAIRRLRKGAGRTVIAIATGLLTLLVVVLAVHDVVSAGSPTAGTMVTSLIASIVGSVLILLATRLLRSFGTR